MDDGAKAGTPSKVIHVRNVGPEITQSDLASLAAPFGVVQHVLLLKSKNQALIQMQDISAAVNMMTYYSTVPANVRGRNVYLQFSSHQELTGESSRNRVRETDDTNGHRGDSAPPNHILLVTIHNPLYPITVDVLNQVFSPHGTVEKIVIFNKTAGLQALVQYSSVQHAVQAKTTLNGQNIYAGSCTLHIQFSNLKDLTVHHNTDKTRDFTNPNLPTEPPARRGDNMGGVMGGGGVIGGSPQGRQFNDHFNPRGGQSDRGFQQHGRQQMGGQFGQLGGMGGNMGQLNQLQQLSQLAAMSGMTPAAMQQLLAAQQQGMGGGMGGYPNVGPGGGQGQQNLATLGGIAGTDRSVLLVSNLNVEKADCDAIFNLFSNYGNIVRIKILHNKRDHALVQMGDNIQSTTAMNYLKSCVMFGNTIDVNYSKHSYISSTPDQTGQDQLTKDYTNSPMNRFVRNASKNYKHICPPGTMLHLSNLASSITKETIMNVFEPFGGIANLKFFETSGKKQCLLQYFDVQSAIDALVSMHNKPVEGQNIRVAFSKNTI